MSNQPEIQSSPAPEAGAQEPLVSDIKSRQGHDCPQNTLSFCRGTEVAASSAVNNTPTSPTPNNRPSDLHSGMSMSGREQENARQVDHKVIEGSHGAGSDFRQKAAPAVLPANPGPRDATGQAGS